MEVNEGDEGFPGGSVGKNPPAVQERQETQVGSLNREGPLEEGMASHSSILSWRMPWTEMPGELQSMSGKQLDRTEWLVLSLSERIQEEFLSHNGNNHNKNHMENPTQLT